MPKYVVSSTLDNPTWANTTVIQDDLIDRVKQIRKETDGDVLVGGSVQLVRSLRDHNLVDELRLIVSPVIVGEGGHLFDGLGEIKDLRLVDVRTVDSRGVVQLTYAPVRS